MHVAELHAWSQSGVVGVCMWVSTTALAAGAWSGGRLSTTPLCIIVQ